MNRMREAVVAVGLASGLMVAGCGEPTVEQEARIVGFGQGIDVKVYQPVWEWYVDQQYLPQNETLRNVRSQDEYAGCVEVPNDYPGWNTDDWECDSWSLCEGTDMTYCEAIYEPRYSYERLEDRIVRECLANIVKGEYKKKDPVQDRSCQELATPEQRVEKRNRYLLWLTTKNPDEDEGPKMITQAIEVTADEWQRSDSTVTVTAVVQGDQIVDVEL